MRNDLGFPADRPEGRLPEWHDPRPGAAAARRPEAGDAVRLYGFEGDNWLELHVRRPNWDGSVSAALTQCVDGRLEHLGDATAVLDARGVSFSGALPRDAFGKTMESYRAVAWGGESASNGRRAYACAELPDEPLAPGDALRLSGYAPENWLDLDVLSASGFGAVRVRGTQVVAGRRWDLGTFLVRVATDGVECVGTPPTDAFGRAMDGYRAPFFSRIPSAFRRMPKEVPAAVVEKDVAIPVTPEGSAAAGVALSVTATKVTVERTVSGSEGRGAVVETAPDRSPDVEREISRLPEKSGGKILWRDREVVLFRLSGGSFSVRPPKIGPETYTPAEGGPWNAQKTSKLLWDLWLELGGDAFDADSWTAQMAGLAERVGAAREKAANRQDRHEVFMADLDAALSRADGKPVTRAGRKVRSGGSDAYLVHVESGETEARAAFFAEVNAKLEGKKETVRGGMRIRREGQAWKLRATGAKTWETADDAGLWAAFSEGLLWERWERRKFAVLCIKSRKGHKGESFQEVGIDVTHATPETRVVAPAVPSAAVTMSESVTVTRVETVLGASVPNSDKTIDAVATVEPSEGTADDSLER